MGFTIHQNPISDSRPVNFLLRLSFVKSAGAIFLEIHVLFMPNKKNFTTSVACFESNILYTAGKTFLKVI